MNNKKILLIDATSMMKNAYYALPANCVNGIRNLVVRMMEEKNVDYIASSFGALKENKAMSNEFLDQEALLKVTFTALKIPVYTREGAYSEDLIASMTKSCLKEGTEVVILTDNRNLLLTVRDKVTVLKPTLGEEMELKSWTPDEVNVQFGLEPEQLKDAFSLEYGAGIGCKTACQLINRYDSLDSLYEQKGELVSDQIRNRLIEQEEKVKAAFDTLTFRSDYEFHFDDINSIAETEIAEVMNMDFEPAFLPEESEPEPSKGWNIKEITSFSDAEAVFETCKTAARLGLHVAGTDKKISAVALSLSEEECYYLAPNGSLTEEYLKEKTEKICTSSIEVTVLDLKSQLPFLNLDAGCPVFDASVAAYLLDPLKTSYEYNELAEEYLQLTLPSKSELLGKRSLHQMFDEARQQAVTYICSKAYVSFLCGNLLREALKKAEMERLFYDIEMPLVYSLFTMEETGIRVERDRLKEYGDRLKIRIKETEEKIYEQTGETFNINSPKQLGEVLFEHMKLPGGKKTKTGYSTAADVLEKLAPDYPVVGLVLDYRQLSKLNSTYADGLAAYIGPDERIHGTFNQTITATGRISSTEPNLQNIPIRMELGREIRKVFVPKEGCVFVDADYSQIELRVLAHMSGDSRLIGAYKQAEDIHAITASEVFHVPLNEVTSLQRRNAKAVNFGIVYGISSFGLSEGLSITRKEASEYIEKYFETYPGVKLFLDKLVTDAKENGYAVSMFGRRRPVPELKSSNFMQRSFGERVAMNSPIQGTAADIMKIAMIRVDGALKKQGLKSKIVLQVHDELLIETVKEELDHVKHLLVEEMKQAAKLAVSLEVEANVGESWFDAK